ncbi:hypothetical protein L7F22_058408 [Adiantum nelumboides]|nr:hypothetical protein [Adiantum nelumboides]
MADDLKSRLTARWSLQGYKALVTGGSAGVGKGIVEELAALGASVYTCARSSSSLKDRLLEWKEAGFDVAGSVCDVSSRPQCIELMKSVSDHFAGNLDILILKLYLEDFSLQRTIVGAQTGIRAVDLEHVLVLEMGVHSNSFVTDRLNHGNKRGLTYFVSRVKLEADVYVKSAGCAMAEQQTTAVNNVGLAREKPTLEQSEDDYKTSFSTNLESGYHLSQLAHPMLKLSKNVSIVFVSSIAGYCPIAHPTTLYCMTKGAMHQLTKSLAYEWANDMIRVNCVAPGAIETEQTREI